MLSIPKILTAHDNDFPPADSALKEPNGLLAIGGDLSPQRLLSAYRQGIFPWYNPADPILWWSPDPRAVIYLDKFHVSHSLRKTLRKKIFAVTANKDFARVVNACAQPRPKQTGTWITSEMQAAYSRLHQLGHAHSIEVWQDNTLIGGIYGVAMKPVFCAESMFSKKANGSKIALFHLINILKQNDYLLIDSQIMNAHLRSLGAEEISRQDYLKLLKS